MALCRHRGSREISPRRPFPLCGQKLSPPTSGRLTWLQESPDAAGKSRPSWGIPGRIPFGQLGGPCSPSHGPPSRLGDTWMQARGVQNSWAAWGCAKDLNRPRVQAPGLEWGTRTLHCPLTWGPSLAALGVAVQRWVQHPTDTYCSGMYGSTER